MSGDERIRLFCALELPPAAVSNLAAWQGEHLPVAGGAALRVVPAGNLHVTLAFLGRRPAAEVPAIADVLAGVAREAPDVELRPVTYRETRSVGMILYEDPTGRAAALAEALADGLEELGVYRPERRRWRPHVTVVRFRTRAGLAPLVTNICSFRAVRTALYSSALRPGGAQYEALVTAALGGR